MHALVLRNGGLSRGGLSCAAILAYCCGCCLGPPHVTQGQVLLQVHCILGHKVENCDRVCSAPDDTILVRAWSNRRWLQLSGGVAQSTNNSHVPRPRQSG